MPCLLYASTRPKCVPSSDQTLTKLWYFQLRSMDVMFLRSYAFYIAAELLVSQNVDEDLILLISMYSVYNFFFRFEWRMLEWIFAKGCSVAKCASEVASRDSVIEKQRPSWLFVLFFMSSGKNDRCFYEIGILRSVAYKEWKIWFFSSAYFFVHLTNLLL